MKTARGGFTAKVMSQAELMQSVGMPARSISRAISPTD
jgi:hypothetical protein